MLKQLNLKNIVLVEEAHIPFQPGFNVISGETGAGKSALMAALQQTQGARADVQLIRHGFEKGIIEAVFDIDHLPDVQSKLHEAGIEHEEGDELLIRREISINGKSRLFINNQLSHLSTLRSIADNLFEIVGQHANQQLFDIRHHLEILDLFGDLLPLRNTYAEAYEKECVVRKQLAELRDSEQRRARDLEICKIELEELENGSLKEDEEEELFIEYTRLNNTETLAQLSGKIASILDSPVVSELHSLKKATEELLALDPELEDSFSALQSATVELEELSRTFHNYYSSIEHDPYRAETINQRLTEINKLKKKYGPTVEDALRYQEELQEKLFKLENAEEEIEELETTIDQLEKQTRELATNLSNDRVQIAQQFSESMTQELRSLNMPNASFFVEVEKQKLSQTGQDKIEFFFAPNKGEKKVPIRECASGGEISRLLLSVQTLLAGKASIPCLVFDEIDANIGGLTASIVGQKLSMIGKNHQLLCITHFPQVADAAKHHIQISKKEKGDRTVTEVKVLDHSERESELMRMVGK